MVAVSLVSSLNFCGHFVCLLVLSLGGFPFLQVSLARTVGKPCHCGSLHVRMLHRRTHSKRIARSDLQRSILFARRKFLSHHDGALLLGSQLEGALRRLKELFNVLGRRVCQALMLEDLVHGLPLLSLRGGGFSRRLLLQLDGLTHNWG